MEIDYRAEMALPTSKSCSDCVHIKRCVAFGFTDRESASCDFHPSRFRPAPTSTDLEHRE